MLREKSDGWQQGVKPERQAKKPKPKPQVILGDNCGVLARSFHREIGSCIAFIGHIDTFQLEAGQDWQNTLIHSTASPLNRFH